MSWETCDEYKAGFYGKSVSLLEGEAEEVLTSMVDQVGEKFGKSTGKVWEKFGKGMEKV